jgi:hypothetical protein
MTMLAAAVVFGEGPLLMQFNAGEISERAEYRVDMPQYGAGCSQLENMLVMPQGAAFKRPGTVMAGPGNSTSGEYKTRTVTWQFVNESGGLWGLPFDSPTTIVGPDAGKRARAVGGNINPDFSDSLWAIPCHNHPFKAGQYIRVFDNGGTSCGTALYAVQAETTQHDIVVLKGTWGSFSDSPFTGVEVIVAYRSLTSGMGRMVMDRAGNMYIATNNTGDERGIIKVNYDMTEVDEDFFEAGGSLATSTMGLGYYEAEDHDEFLYAWGAESKQLIKFRLDDGSIVWISDSYDSENAEYWASYWADCTTPCPTDSHPAVSQSYDMAVDTSGNAYIMSSSSQVQIGALGYSGSGFTDHIVSRVEPHWYLEVEDYPVRIRADGEMVPDEFGEGDELIGLESGARCTVIDVDTPLLPGIPATKYEITEPVGELIIGEAIMRERVNPENGSIYAIIEDVDEEPEFDDWYNACVVPPYGRGVYSIIVDEDMGLVIGGTNDTAFSHPDYLEIWPEENLWTYSLGGSFRDAALVGDPPEQIGSGSFYNSDAVYSKCLVSDGEYIYFLNMDEEPNDVLYKLTPQLAVVDSVEVTYARGIVLDAFGQIAVIRSYNRTDPAGSMVFYDTDLNETGRILTGMVDGYGFFNQMLSGWGNELYSYGYIKGDWCWRKPLESIKREGTIYNNAAYPMAAAARDPNNIRLIPFEYNTGTDLDGAVIAFGHHSLGVYGEELYWTEDFESAGFDYGGWITTGTAAVTTLASYWQFAGYDHGYYGAKLTGGTIEKRLSTGGNENINIIFNKRTTGTGMTVDWSVDGENWTQAFPSGHSYAMQGLITRALPAAAANQPGFRVRWAGEYVDDITILGGGKAVPGLPEKATVISPADGAVGITAGSTALTWTADGDIELYRVYFGTDSTPDSGELKGVQAAASYTAAASSECETYYWKIDTINQTGITTGDVWSFSTVCPPPGKATITSPADGATDVAITSILDWTNGSNTEEVDIYFGDSSPPPLYASPSYAAGSWTLDEEMEKETTYYWRIDCKNVSGTTEGDEWHFTTAGDVPPLNGVYSAKSGAVGRYGESTLSYKKTMPMGLMSFWVRCPGYFVYFYCDDEFITDHSRYEPEGWTKKTVGIGTAGVAVYPVTAGEHTFKWEYKNTVYTSQGTVWIDNITFTRNDPNFEGFETGDFTAFDWALSGTPAWTVTDDDPHAGTYAAKGGGTGKTPATNAIEATVTCEEGYVMFWYKTSFPSTSSNLNFYIDGSRQGYWRESQDWYSGSGTYERTFLWRYSEQRNEPYFWAMIDNVTFPDGSTEDFESGVFEPNWSTAGDANWTIEDTVVQTKITSPVSAGEHTFKWVYGKDLSSSEGSDTAWIDEITFPTAGGDAEGFETGDFTAFDWQLSGGQPWIVTDVGPHTGTYCAKAGAITHGQSSVLELTMECTEGEISFFYKVSSEQNYDWFEFYIDDELTGSASGEYGWIF